MSAGARAEGWHGYAKGEGGASARACMCVCAGGVGQQRELTQLLHQRGNYAPASNDAHEYFAAVIPRSVAAARPRVRVEGNKAGGRRVVRSYP
jgi:hypothetical protein